jgi:fructose-specific phosphotransferase system IIC component
LQQPNTALPATKTFAPAAAAAAAVCFEMPPSTYTYKTVVRKNEYPKKWQQMQIHHSPKFKFTLF